MDLDTDVSHYTDQEIKDLLDLSDLNYDDIVTTTQTFMDEYQNQPEIVKFYMDIRERFEPKNKTIEVKNVEVKKGTINPDLKNTISRMINVDSTFRNISNITTIYDTDEYLFSLSEPINNVISLTLYSIELPQSWYTFSAAKGTTTFIPVLIAENGTDTVRYEYPTIAINDGNYTNRALLNMIIKLLFLQCGIFSNQVVAPATTQSDIFRMEQDPYTGACKIIFKPLFKVSNIILPDGTLFTKKYTYCKIGFIFHSLDMGTKINHNLGWLLGYRLPFIIVPDTFSLKPRTEDVLAPSISIMDTSGTKYVILKLDDYQSNRLNKSLVWINAKVEPIITLPSYYNESLSQFQVSPTNINVLPTAPRQLTAKQIFTINSISNTRTNNLKAGRLIPPDDSDIIAKIPIKKVTDWGVVDKDGNYTVIDNGPSKLIVDFSGPLQLSTREYFGPVTIRNISVALYDDKGSVLGLNGVDWSFTLIAKSVYQY